MGYRQVTFQRRHQCTEGHHLTTKRREDEHRASCFCKDRLAKVVQSEDGSIKIQGIALVGVHDVACVDRPPGALELSQILFRQFVTKTRVARWKGKDRARLVGVDEIIKQPECVAPSGSQLWQPQPGRISLVKKRRAALEAVDIAGCVAGFGAEYLCPNTGHAQRTGANLQIPFRKQYARRSSG